MQSTARFGSSFSSHDSTLMQWPLAPPRALNATADAFKACTWSSAVSTGDSNVAWMPMVNGSSDLSHGPSSQRPTALASTFEGVSAAPFSSLAHAPAASATARATARTVTPLFHLLFTSPPRAVPDRPDTRSAVCDVSRKNVNLRTDDAVRFRTCVAALVAETAIGLANEGESNGRSG